MGSSGLSGLRVHFRQFHATVGIVKPMCGHLAKNPHFVAIFRRKMFFLVVAPLKHVCNGFNGMKLFLF